MSQNDPPPIAYEARAYQDVDDSHLNILSICHWIWGGLTILFSSFGLIYVAMGFVFMNGGFPMPTTSPAGSPPPPSPAFIGWIFVIMGSIFTLLGWIIGGMTVAAGFKLRKRNNWKFCIVAASLNCIVVPIGTVLGVFSIIVLSRPAVRARFANH